ncbi:MAG: hypothetical protein AAFY65_02645 [Pseudomonadota bacterium]
MLRFRRNTGPDQAPQTAATSPRPARQQAEGPMGSRDDALALLALLDKSSGPSDQSAVSQDRMRDAARRLVAQIEASPSKQSLPPKPTPEASADRGAGPADAPADAPATGGVRKLFSKAKPLAAPQPPSMPARAAPTPTPTTMPEPVEILDRPRRSRLFARAEVRGLVREGLDRSAVQGEHPAIIALSLEGVAASEQARALRLLGRGQARAVHRALRLLEIAS